MAYSLICGQLGTMQKRYIPTAIAVVAGLCSNAQTLQSGDLSIVPGESFTFGSIGEAEPGAAGSGATWDFSTIAPGGEITYDWETPSAQALMTHPDITVARAVAFSCTEYWEAAQFRFSEYGNGCGITLSHTVYDDPRDAVRYPMALGSSYTDTYSGMTRIGGGAPDSTAVEGTITVTADGTGTLVLPWATQPGVLRLRVEEERVETDWGVTTHWEQHWYVLPGVHMPLLRLIRTWDTENPTPFDYGNVQLPNTTGLGAEYLGSALRMYHANGVLHVDAAADGLLRCEVFTADGRTVRVWEAPRTPLVLPLPVVGDQLLIVRVTDQNGVLHTQRVLATAP